MDQREREQLYRERPCQNCTGCPEPEADGTLNFTKSEGCFYCEDRAFYIAKESK
jgi:hypothetical protein